MAEMCGRLLEHAVNSLCSSEAFLPEARLSKRVNEALGWMLATESATEATELIEWAHLMIAEARWVCVDDGAVAIERRDLMAALAYHHVAACRQAGVDAPAAARRVLEVQIALAGAGLEPGGAELSRWHAETFGEEWCAAYHDLIGERWASLTRIPDENLSLDQRRQQIWLTRQMERRADQQRIGDQLIAFKSRDLSEASAYLDLAQLCLRAGRFEEATEWAKQGSAVCCGRAGDELRGFLIDVCEQGGRGEEAVELLLQDFVARPRWWLYRQVKKLAMRLDQWPERREQVLEVLRQRPAAVGVSSAAKSKQRVQLDDPRDNSDLVGIWLAEGEVEAAWEAAVAGGCTDNLWLELAARRTRSFPTEALAVYKQLIARSLKRKDGYSARQAAKLLCKVRRLMRRLGRIDEFQDYERALRRHHGAQRNFKLVARFIP